MHRRCGSTPPPPRGLCPRGHGRSGRSTRSAAARSGSLLARVLRQVGSRVRGARVTTAVIGIDAVPWRGRSIRSSARSRYVRRVRTCARRRDAARVEHPLRRCRVLHEQVCGTDGPANELATAVGAGAVEDVVRAGAAPRAFVAADQDVGGVGCKVAVAALAAGADLEHGAEYRPRAESDRGYSAVISWVTASSIALSARSIEKNGSWPFAARISVQREPPLYGYFGG